MIHENVEIPGHQRHFIAINRAFFSHRSAAWAAPAGPMAGPAGSLTSAVNRQIVRLEDELGTALFDRVVMAPSHPLAKKTEISFDDCRSHAFVQISRLSPSHSLVVPEFTKFWDELEQ